MEKDLFGKTVPRYRTEVRSRWTRETTLRLNLFRSQGLPEHLNEITWQPPMSKTFHVLEKFGLLKLGG
jgi:hypothetical protein